MYTTFYDKNGMITSILESSKIVADAAILKESELGNKSINGFYKKSEYFIENEIPIKIPEKPNYYSVFNYESKQWEYSADYLNTVKSDTEKLVNSDASEKITSRYPDYKQRNILASGDTVIIQSTWDWINSIRDLSNTTNNAISESQNAQEIDSIYQNYLSALLEL